MVFSHETNSNHIAYIYNIEFLTDFILVALKLKFLCLEENMMDKFTAHAHT